MGWEWSEKSKDYYKKKDLGNGLELLWWKSKGTVGFKYKATDGKKYGDYQPVENVKNPEEWAIKAKERVELKIKA